MSHGQHLPDDASGAGRHRHGGAGTWTPTVPAQSGPHRHESAGHGVPRQRPSDEPYSNTHGHLAGELPRQAGPVAEAPDATTTPQPRHGGTASGGGERRPRRTRVNLTQPERPAVPPPGAAASPGDEQDGTSAADGLSMFNLGSVPASVTPPKTWRRAAWFAAASSGSVMGLLFAGSFMLGEQPDRPQATGEWTYLNRQGGAPAFEREDLLGPTNRADPPSEQAPGSSEAEPKPHTTSSERRGVASDGARATTSPAPSSGPSRPGSGGSPTTRPSGSPTSAPTTTSPPQKPPPEPAEVVVVNERALYKRQMDVEAMASDTQTFYNTVTENPERAHELTTGRMRQQGPAGLRRSYSGIAYFEVEKVVVNEGKAVTRSTVTTVYNDGRSETQTRTLTFDENGKIVKASG